MAKHSISIKNDDLTEDQKMIYNSPIELGKNILVEGGPGTGKTTLLFLIAQKIKNQGLDFRIITLQNNLKNFLKDSFGDLDKHVINAWGTSDIEENPDKQGLMFNKIIPFLDKDFPTGGTFFHKTKNDKYRNDLMLELLKKAKEYTNGKKFKDEIILVDEAQDLPPVYFEILKLFFKNVYVFGDKNQQINDWGTEINDLIQILNINIQNRYYLNINFRNSVQIYNFAKLTGITDGNLEVINRGGKVEIIIGDYDEVKEIKKIILDNIGNNIAIITNYYDQNKYNEIKNVQIVNSNKEYIKLDTYDNFCLHWKNNKGLEFDIVILIGFIEEQFFTKEMYVSITRTGYNKRNNTGWKLYVLDNNIKNYLKLENNSNFNITNKNNIEEEIYIEDTPFYF
ncbi:MAG: AAA family ATPase [Candidatus Gracilibacteria bacterium]|nr:AAA family ATPase [Candidatus Gracilibacteria bacterium]MDD4530407.1 AAA family ATPase [Candidatus Gracilibacteria bacterium]